MASASASIHRCCAPSLGASGSGRTATASSFQYNRQSARIVVTPATAANAWASFDEFAEAKVVRTDADKEAARKTVRVLFGEKDWKRHRSSARFVRHLSTLAVSGVIKGVLWHVAIFTLLACGVALWNQCIVSAWAALPAPPNIAIEPIQLTSFALSLLLVFRTNASYARYMEGRAKFGALATTARDLIRQANAWFPADDNGQKSKRMLSRWLLALARCTMCHLRYQEAAAMTEELRGTLPQHEVEWLMKAAHKPYFCVQMVTRIIAQAGLKRPETVMQMDHNCSLLVQSVSSCERICNTPIPMSYTRHTARILMLWLSYMPFSLWSYCGWAMIPITSLVAFVLLGIEEIGVYIEEPFSLLPLESLCQRLEVGLEAMMKEHADIEVCLPPLVPRLWGESMREAMTPAVSQL